MTAPGPWRDDSVPTWFTINSPSTSTSDPDRAGYVSRTWDEGSGFHRQADWNAQFDDIWNLRQLVGGGANTGLADLKAEAPVVPANGPTIQWQVRWILASRPANYTVTTGVLPSSAQNPDGSFVDPNVVGVEWDPAGSTALDQRLTIALIADSAGTPATYVAGESVHVKINAPIATAGTTETAAQLAAHDTFATFAAPSITLTDADLPWGINDAVSNNVTVVDHFTHSQAPPPADVYPFQRSWGFQFTFDSLFAPQYRLIYADQAASGRIPPIRHVQRGDGLGLSTAPRMSQLSSIQGSLRNSSYL